MSGLCRRLLWAAICLAALCILCVDSNSTLAPTPTSTGSNASSVTPTTIVPTSRTSAPLTTTPALGGRPPSGAPRALCCAPLRPAALPHPGARVRSGGPHSDNMAARPESTLGAAGQGRGPVGRGRRLGDPSGNRRLGWSWRLLDLRRGPRGRGFLLRGQLHRGGRAWGEARRRFWSLAGRPNFPGAVSRERFLCGSGREEGKEKVQKMRSRSCTE